MTRSALAVRHLAFEDLGLLEPLLAARGYDVRYLEAGVDPLPADALTAPDLVVILGGPIGVYETAAYPVLDAEYAALDARLAAKGPTLGICLGAQLIARVLGAEVTATGRKEIGYGPLTLTAEGQASVLAPLDGEPVLHWHGDAFAIPPGATRLAETPGFPNQAFAVDTRLLGLQFHIEADHTRMEQWLIGHANELATAGLDPARIRADARAYGPALAERASRVLHAWLDGIETAP